MIVKLTALALLLTLAAAAPAGAAMHVTGATPQQQRWLERSLMPLPSVSVTFLAETCPGTPEGETSACTSMGSGTIWIAPTLRSRATTLHEVGHQFDYAMSDTLRRDFLRISHDPRPWRSPPNSPHEQFAEAYYMCAVYERSVPAWIDHGYGYEPTSRMHRRICAAIRREAARQGWARAVLAL